MAPPRIKPAPPPPPARRRSWLTAIVLGASIAVAVACAWWVRRPAPSVAEPGLEHPADPGNSIARSRRRDPIGYVSSLAGKDDSQSIAELIRLYDELAAFPETLEARRVALHAMLAHPSVNVALEAVLSAVDGDQTRREQDPLWHDLVGGVAKLWDAVTFSLGRDRMYAEERAKPHDLLLESLAQASPDKLSDPQRTQLTSDLIDLYPGIKPEQKAIVDLALTRLGGPDLVEILAGRGPGKAQDQGHYQGHYKDGTLDVIADRNRAIEAARAIRPPPIAPEEEEIPPTVPPPPGPH